jgi:ribose transport system permease protein
MTSHNPSHTQKSEGEARLAQAAATAAADAPSDRFVALRELLLTRQAAMTVVAIGLFAWFSLTANNFFAWANVLDIMRATSFIGIVAVAWTYLLIVGELDLSVGSLYGLGTIIMSWCIGSFGLDPWAAAGLTLLFGVFIGFLNGVITVYVGVNAFVATLGMLSLLRGFAFVISGGYPIPYPRELKSSLFPLGDGSLFGIPAPAIWLLAVMLVGGFVLARTKFGYWLYAAGGNELAAREMGIPTKRIKLIAFTLVGFSCGLIAVLNGAWIKSANTTTGSGFEFQVIGAVLVGGAALNGGAGNIYGTFVGAFILGIVANGLVMAGFSPATGFLATGAIIIIAGSVDVILRHYGGRVTRKSATARPSSGQH